MAYSWKLPVTEYHTEPVLRVAPSIKRSMKKYKIMTYLFCQAASLLVNESTFTSLHPYEMMTVAVAVCGICSSRLVGRV